MTWVNKQVTLPEAFPELLTLVKRHLAVDYADDDALLTQAVAAALEYAEGHTGRAFGVRSFLLQGDEWPDNGEIEFPLEPVLSVDEVRYTADGGGSVVVNPSLYATWLDRSPPLLLLKSGFTYPALDSDTLAAIEIEYEAGEEALPALLIQAVQLTVGYWQEQPGGEVSLGHLSRGMPAGAIQALNMLWTGAL